MIESIGRDVGHTLRMLRRRPGFAIVAVLTIAVGLGGMAVAFTAVDVFVTGAPQFELPGGGWVFIDDQGPTEGEATFREYEAFVREAPSLDVAASTVVVFSHRRQGVAERIFGLAVSTNYFELQDVVAALGSAFRSGDSRLSVVVSDRFWRERLNGASLTGLTVELNGLDVPVAGVLPRDHGRGTYDPAVWVRIDDWDALGLPMAARAPAAGSLSLIGRLRPGATPAHATRQLAAVSDELARAWVDSQGGRKARFVPFAEGTPEIRAIGLAALTATAMIGVVLLIALFNLVGLLLARAVDREREMSLRGALGAGRGRLVRQLVTESVVITALGGVLALVVARFSSVLLRSFAMQSPIPSRVELDLNWTVAGLLALVVLVCGVGAGLLPARRATRVAIAAVIGPSRVAGGPQSRLRTLVIGLQVAGATLLLAMAALLVRSAVLSGRTPTGFEQERAVLVELFPANHGFGGDAAQRFVLDAVDRVRALPGVVAAAVADRTPFYVGYKWQMKASIDGVPCDVGTCPSVAGYRVGPDYFQAMKIPIVRGRELDGSAADAKSLVVSQTMARRFWPATDPLGQWITLDGTRRLQVVGVAADVLHRGLTERPEPYVYVPIDRDAFAASVTVIARTASDPGPLLPAVSETVRALNASMPIWSLQTMAQRLDARAYAGGRILARFFLVCGGLGLFLALVGLAGSVAYSVRQRTRELGVRAAVGATPGDLGRLVVGGALRVSAIGVAVGSASALALVTLVKSVVTGLDLDSPTTVALVALLLMAIVVAAAAVPGRRAARVDPLSALRAE